MATKEQTLAMMEDAGLCAYGEDSGTYGVPVPAMINRIGRIIDAAMQLGAASANADSVRMNWLADPENAVGNVQLPTQCVTDNVHSLRAAIDAAMKLPAPSNNQAHLRERE